MIKIIIMRNNKENFNSLNSKNIENNRSKAFKGFKTSTKTDNNNPFHDFLIKTDEKSVKKFCNSNKVIVVNDDNSTEDNPFTIENYFNKKQREFKFENKPKVRFFSKTFLEKMLSFNENEIIKTLFDLDLKEKLNSTKFLDESIKNMITIINKICSINSDPVKEILKNILNSNFFNVEIANFLRKLQFTLHISSNKNELIMFLKSLLNIFTEISNKFSSNLTSLPINDLINSIDIMDNNEEFRENLDIKQLKSKSLILKNNIQTFLINEHMMNFQLKKKPKNENEVPITYQDQDLSLTTAEIVNNIKPILQKHREKGTYDSWERYINTLFYLVREDCYRSLRECIYRLTKTKVFNNVGEKENRDIYIYKDIKIVDLEIGIKGIIFTLRFDTNLKSINWTKRMLYGSLLVITTENVRDFILATVIEMPDKNNKKDKKENTTNKDHCKVTLLDNSFENLFRFLQYKNKSFIMFESKAYYEAYCHIMRRLQRINSHQLPFTDIIINYERNNVNMIPDYLLNNTLFTYEGEHFIANSDKWPNSLEKILDKSQFLAIKHCIRNKVAIIQGPPGTGKTYVGALVTKILLKNTDKPILIVCYTNHALDQFLKHISKFESKIIRIGGRCINEDMNKYTLQYKRNRNIQKKSQLSMINWKIHDISKSLLELTETVNFKKILKYNQFSRHYPEIKEKIFQDFIDLTGFDVKSNEWLIGDTIYKVWSNTMDINILFDKLNRDFDPIHPLKLAKLYKIFKIESFNLKINENSNNQIENQKILSNDFIEEEKEIDDEEDDIEDLNENLNRLELDKNINYDSLEEETYFKEGDENIKNENLGPSLSDEEFKYFTTKFNIWEVGRDIRNRISTYMKEKYTGVSESRENIIFYNKLINQKKELENMNDIEIIRNEKVVGMTTTGCSKYSTILEQMNFEIVIVEEAAEILESHIATILTQNTRHLIMIGDHQQLRPNPYNYEISSKYKFDISMFERLINNNVPKVGLEFQRRMRPEFADFIRLIYKSSYLDHQTSFTKPNVKGVMSNIFFINHKENESLNTNLSSKKNEHEAKLITSLARYFVQQGYEMEKITILTFYIGQVLLIRDELKKLGYIQIRVVTVDNYQGEENDLILLSLVRSNKENKIGFLKSFNRVCVAFSRAILGFYVIGNFDCIIKGQDERKNKNTDDRKVLWKEIYELAIKKKVIADSLNLICQKHKKINVVKQKKDFDNLPEGGCSELCKARLDCGHVCEYYCHNFPHQKKLCRKECHIIHNCGHKCTKSCGDECGNCMTRINKILNCGHIVLNNCYKQINEIFCNNKCEKTLICSHMCQKKCGDKCSEKECKILVSKKLLCGHFSDIECNQAYHDKICDKKCNKVLNCGHICNGTCGECLDGTLHIPCRIPCKKNLICNHICKKECSQACICEERCNNKCSHGFCSISCSAECVNCIEKCENGCNHRKCNKLCFEICKLEPCNKKCNLKLKCGHECIGLCGEKCPKLCRICNKEDDNFNIFFGYEDSENAIFYSLSCGHIFEISGLDKYMNEGISIIIKSCPKCKSVITVSKRYGDLIKKSFKDIQTVKKKMLEKYTGYETIYQKTSSIVSDNLKKYSEEITNFDSGKLLQKFKNIDEKDYYILISVYNLCNLCEKMFLIEKEVEKYEIMRINLENDEDKIYFLFLYNLKIVKLYFQKFQSLSNDFFKALDRKIENLFCYSLIKFQKIKQFNILLPKLERTFFDIPDILLKNVNDYFPKIGRQEILIALEAVSGTWYKCPNGHIYTVGECGSPMEQSNCPECKSKIGGLNHNPLYGNYKFGSNDL